MYTPHKLGYCTHLTILNADFQVSLTTLDNNCIRGFPGIPVSEVDDRTSNSRITTQLIPEMNFTCNATIVGFIVAGRNLNNGPHSQVQIWRKNSSQNSTVYYKVESFSVDTAGSGSTVCMAERVIVGNTRWCILRDNFQVSVQPGDVFGLELPRTNNDEIFFTSGGPVNYIFGRQLNSDVNLSHNGSYSNAQQLPQIVFNLTSGKPWFNLQLSVWNSKYNCAPKLRYPLTFRSLLEWISRHSSL